MSSAFSFVFLLKSKERVTKTAVVRKAVSPQYSAIHLDTCEPLLSAWKLKKVVLKSVYRQSDSVFILICFYELGLTAVNVSGRKTRVIQVITRMSVLSLCARVAINVFSFVSRLASFARRKLTLLSVWVER
jgi:hypothetical protein